MRSNPVLLLSLTLPVLGLVGGLPADGASVVGAPLEVFAIPERTLVPEGIAHDPATGRFFVSSVYLAKIVSIRRDGGVGDFIGSGEHGFYGGVGMKVDSARGLLWAASGMGYQTRGFTADADGLSGLFAFDLEDGSLRHRFLLANESEKHLLNDLVLDAGGALYVTDTLTSRIYRVPSDLSGLGVFEVDGELPYPNGIALSGDGALLYVATDEGIRLVEVATGAVHPLAEIEAGQSLGIDGLYWHEGSLIAVQNHRGFNRVARFRLQADDSGRVAALEILAAGHPAIRIPTTGLVLEDHFYFIANSHLDSFDEAGSLIPERLTEPVVLRVGLSGR